MKRTFTKYPSGYVKADLQVYTNLDLDNMYDELDRQYAQTPNAKKFISDSIDLHLRYRFITAVEARRLREKYLGDN